MAVTKLDVTRQATFSGDTSISSHKLTSVLDPTNPQDAATKAYVDSTASGLDWKASVRATTTTNGTLATAYANGQVIDGVTLATGDRILLKDQTTGSENGIYVVAASGAPARSSDANSSTNVTANLAVFVEEGTSNSDSGWTLTNNGAIVLGTTALVFVQFTGLGQVTAGAGMTKSGNTINVIATDTSMTINADDLSVHVGDASLEVSSGLRIKHSSNPGDVYIGNASNVATPTTLTGDVSTITGAGVVTLASTVYKAANFVNRETPTPAVDGSTTVFTLANTPTAGSEMVFLNGLLQEPGAGNDYTISGATITYLTAPLSTDRLRVSYRK